MVKRRDFLKDSLLLVAGAIYSPNLFAKKTIVNNAKNVTVSLKRNVPVRYDADIVVVGGGIAGISAACSAAFSGANVILIERFGALGGMLTTGGVANFCGQIDAQGEVFDEILSYLKKFNSLGEGDRASVFNYEIMALLLQEILLKRKVKILLQIGRAHV